MNGKVLRKDLTIMNYTFRTCYTNRKNSIYKLKNKVSYDLSKLYYNCSYMSYLHSDDYGSTKAFRNILRKINFTSFYSKTYNCFRIFI